MQRRSPGKLLQGEEAPGPDSRPAVNHHLPLHLHNTIVCPQHLLVVMEAPGGWLVSGLTLTSPHCVSCRMTHGRVLSGHRAQLQGELVLGCVPADGGVILDGGAVVTVTIIIYAPHPC